MKISEKTLKWILRLYPPLLLQRIWIQGIFPEFKGASVKINRSIITLNFGNAIFGGTISTATDPFYALLFGQLLKHKGYNISIWVKSSHVKFVKPARTDLYYTIIITDEMIKEAEDELNKNGAFLKSYPIHLYNNKGVLHAIAQNEIYIRKK